MVNYVCENCSRVFKQKGHLETHQSRKNPCEKNTTLENIIEEKVKEALLKTNEQVVKIDTITSPQIQSNTIDYSQKTREELIVICKEKNIKGYSGKKKDDIVKLLNSLNNSTKNLTYIDLFAGIGGFRYGINLFQQINPYYSFQ